MADAMVGEVDGDVLARYEIKKRIGKGAYGIVWKAIDKATKETVAMKKIFDAFRNKTDAQRTFREVMFLRQFGQHTNIIKLLSVMKAENDLDLYLVLEYMDSDLHDVIKRGHMLKDIHKRYIMFQLLNAIKCLHSMNVIHRDLKPSNVLINADCHIRVADFGLARSLTQVEEDYQGDPTLTEYVATRWYRAPEILLADKLYTTGVDMWSLGCILGEILLEKPLFTGTSTLNQIERIMSAIALPTAKDIASMCTGYALTVLERAINRPKRSIKSMIPNAPEDALDLMSKLLVFNPSKRLSAQQALSHPYVSKFKSALGDSPKHSVCVEPKFTEDGQLTVNGYRQKLYQLIEEKSWKKNVSDIVLPTKKTDVENELLPELDASLEPELKTSSPKGFPPRSKVGKWIASELTSSPHDRTDVTELCASQESVRSSPIKDAISSSKKVSLSPSRSFDEAPHLGLPPAGLPSYHPKASATSPWLRFHSTDIVARDLDKQNLSKKQQPFSTKAVSSDRPRPNFGRKQFGNYSNTSSLGSPRATMQSYAQNHGTITASAFRKLRLGN